VAVTDADGFDGVLLSPGPGTPEQAGVCVEMVKHCAATRQPLFGVCLGLQSIGVAFGATVGRAPELMHGKTSEVDARRARGLRGPGEPVHRDPLPLAGDRPGDRARRSCW
jgi:para-aminobenzoate synthetase component 2